MRGRKRVQQETGSAEKRGSAVRPWAAALALSFPSAPGECVGSLCPPWVLRDSRQLLLHPLLCVQPLLDGRHWEDLGDLGPLQLILVEIGSVPSFLYFFSL